MLNFESDYTVGAHEVLINRLVETNMEQLSGYGNDKYCESAKEKIRIACGCPQAEVHLLVGGTQTNQLVISSVLGNCGGVIAAETGHIEVHEAGAIEYTGHKVLTLPAKDGKLEASSIKAYLEGFYADETHSHMVWPEMVYISNPTEYGTLYSKAELTAISEVCREYKMTLYIDGARLGYGLVSDGNDVTLADIAELCDVFYIGGTKVGALCGEAVVFTKNNTPKHFFTEIKQHGALLAKGRLLGVQFDALFTDDLYFTISRHAIDMANKLRGIFKEKGYSFLIETVTNQIFVILENSELERIRNHAKISVWEPVDTKHTAVRFATSWATREEDIESLRSIL